MAVAGKFLQNRLNALIDHRMGIMELSKKSRINILTLKGSILQEDADQLEELLEKVGSFDSKNLIVDMVDVSHISSIAVGCLVQYKKRHCDSNFDIRLVATDEDLLQLFEITMLDRVFSIHYSMDEAMQSFALTRVS